MSSSGQAAASRSANERTLDGVMRAPSTTTPDVVVVVEAPAERADRRTEIHIDPKQDLWVSTVDDRYQSRIIPVRVGEHAETFYVHRDILTKAEYFKKALDGQFKEAIDQAVDLPEEEPAIFSFLIAFLYEGTYMPIKCVADALAPDPEKGKAKEGIVDVNHSDDDSGSETSVSGSDDMSDHNGRGAHGRRRAENRLRREQQAWDQRYGKQLGRHRPGCNCLTCSIQGQGPFCWSCGANRTRPNVPRGHALPPPPNFDPNTRARVRARAHADGLRRQGIILIDDEIMCHPRFAPEDLRTWLMVYELSVDVYLCAERYLMEDFKQCVEDFIVHNFETAGIEAAQPQVLASCAKLHSGLSINDVLLKKIFARVGFLLARLWKNFPEETHSFWMENPDVGAMIMKETMERRAVDTGDDLPPMHRAGSPFSSSSELADD